MDLSAQLRSAIIAQNIPCPSDGFLKTLITARSPPPPLPSLIATAKARILACDISAGGILDPSLTSLPLGVDNPQNKDTPLPRDVYVQILDIEDLSASRWEQVLELEAVERGERTRGREIIRVTADAADEVSESQHRRQGDFADTSASTSSRSATHRVALQDCKGRKIFGLELQRMERLGVGKTGIGEKVLLKAGSVVARGVVLLEPKTCVFLGGRVEAWHKAWMDGRLERLKEAARIEQGT